MVAISTTTAVFSTTATLRTKGPSLSYSSSSSSSSSVVSLASGSAKLNGLRIGSSKISPKTAVFPRRYACKAPRSAGAAVCARASAENSVHDFTVKDIDGKEVSLSKFKGKALLIVNVASQCGLTSSNYSELSKVYDKYKTQGFEILAFPCNQFGFQEPGSNSEIKQLACTRFKADFPIFDKVDVNGPFTVPLYTFLKSSSGGFLGDLIKWNFEKFLVDKNGNVVERYPPTTSPLQIEKDIKELVAA